MSAMLYLVTYHTGDSRTSSEVSDLQRVPDTHFQRSQQTGKGRQKKKGNYEETMGCENGMIWALRKGKWVRQVCREIRVGSPAGVVVEGSHDCIWGKASPRDVACAASVRESRGAIDGWLYW